VTLNQALFMFPEKPPAGCILMAIIWDKMARRVIGERRIPRKNRHQILRAVRPDKAGK
jgi:hypothetical protein